MSMKEWLTRRMKKAGENIESTLTQIFFLALVGGTAAILALSKTALSFVLQLAAMPTPLWVAISLTILCCTYVYLRSRSYIYHEAEPDSKISQHAKSILILFGQQANDICLTTENLSAPFGTTFHQTQAAIDQLTHLGLLYPHASYAEDTSYSLSTKGRAFLNKEKLL